MGTTSEVIEYAISLERFALWVCDQQGSLPDVVTATAQKVLAKGNNIDLSKAVEQVCCLNMEIQQLKDELNALKREHEKK